MISLLIPETLDEQSVYQLPNDKIYILNGKVYLSIQ